MSWFDTSNLASIAKTALKEAQRTLDNALDIKSEETHMGHIGIEALDNVDVPVGTPTDFDHTQDVKPQKLQSHILANDTLQTASLLNIKSEDDLEKVCSESDLPESLPINQQPHGNREDLANIFSGPNFIDIPFEKDGNSEKTLIASDVSLIDLSSIDSIMDDRGDMSQHNSALMDSRNLMSTVESRTFVESNMHEIVKIGSVSSGHASSDEIETTSSDIEIISSPHTGYCDSSSTQSRQSPFKKTKAGSVSLNTHEDVLGMANCSKVKGHSRELSVASSLSDDSSNNLPNDKELLMNRIDELNELLRETDLKLVELQNANKDLNEINNRFTNEILNLFPTELNGITEEPLQYLLCAKQKFNHVLNDNADLKTQLEACQVKLNTLASNYVTKETIAVKDDLIQQLRDEGEKLSRQQLNNSNIIKKLRGKEKETSSTIKVLQDKVEKLSNENENLKRTLVSKEASEQRLSESLNENTIRLKKNQSDLLSLQSQHEDLVQKYDALKTTLDTTRTELTDKNKMLSNMQQYQNMVEIFKVEKENLSDRLRHCQEHMEQLQSKLWQTEQEHMQQMEEMRRDKTDLSKQLLTIEMANEELTQAVVDASMPLSKHLQQQQVLEQKIIILEENEILYKQRIADQEKQLHNLNIHEKQTLNELSSSQLKLTELHMELNKVRHDKQMVIMRMQELEEKHRIREQNLALEIDRLTHIIEDLENKNKQLVEDVSLTQKEINMENEVSTHIENHSPAMSMEKISMTESFNGSIWSQDDCMELRTPSVNQTAKYTSQILEVQTLQSDMKQKESEIQQLQWELSRREQEKNVLISKMTNVLAKCEELEEKIKQLNHTRDSLVLLQERYDTLCQLFGEKVEENEELRLDLTDIKEMYRTQLNDLLQQQNAAN